MARLIEVWRKSTGQKYEHPVPDSWIRDQVNPDLTAIDPSTPEAIAPDEQPTDDLKEV